MTLSNKAKLSLYKKSEQSGISYGILEEVYHRGYSVWNESFKGTPEQFAFDRVNSFISGGFAKQLDEDLMSKKRGLWDNIHAKRKRIAAGSGERMRKPGEKGAPTAKALRDSQTEEYIEEKKVAPKYKRDPNNPLSKYDDENNPTEIRSQNLDPKQHHPHKKKDVEVGKENKKKKSKVFSTIKEVVSEKLEEATYQGKTVTLNKPFKTPGGPKKSAVYVKDPKSGNVKIVRFGDPNLSIKKHRPARKRSYCARSSGQGNLTNKLSANYWSRKAWDC